MKRYIVLSVDNNQDYMYHLPLTVWAWRCFGWEPLVLYYNNEQTPFFLTEIELLVFKSYGRPPDIIAPLPYRSATIAQISRLYAAALINEEAVIMTGDVDLLPLGDHWNPNGKPMVWNYDLTGYTEFPICFISMTKTDWCKVMNIDNVSLLGDIIKRDLDSMPNAKSDDFYKWWGVDQQLITQRLKPYNPTIINRGQYPNGYARARVDRGNWTLDHKEYIDAHLHHQIHHKGNEWKFDQTMELLHKIWPNENFDWFVEYTKEFKKLTGHL